MKHVHRKRALISKGALEIRSHLLLPEFVIQHVKELVQDMLLCRQKGLARGNFEAEMVRDNHIYAISVKTRFRESKRCHGILFRASILLHRACRRIGKLLINTGTEIVKATIIFRRTPDPSLN